jgi:hypothetical protein
VRSYRTISPLPRTVADPGRYIFCGTFRGLASPRRYLAPCRRSPDFPPRPTTGVIGWSDCLADSAATIDHVSPERQARIRVSEFWCRKFKVSRSPNRAASAPARRRRHAAHRLFWPPGSRPDASRLLRAGPPECARVHADPGLRARRTRPGRS